MRSASMFDAISFAGRGNRCYWQGGFFEALAARIELGPKLAVGVSAGKPTRPASGRRMSWGLGDGATFAAAPCA